MRRMFLFLVLCGCAGVHLGDDHGKRTKGAFQAQADAADGGDGMLDAEDARTILSRHRNKEPKVPPPPAASTVLHNGGGTTGPIKLDSVR